MISLKGGNSQFGHVNLQETSASPSQHESFFCEPENVKFICVAANHSLVKDSQCSHCK